MWGGGVAHHVETKPRQKRADAKYLMSLMMFQLELLEESKTPVEVAFVLTAIFSRTAAVPFRCGRG